VFDDLVGALIAVAFIATKISENKSNNKVVQARTSKPAVPAATADVNRIACVRGARSAGCGQHHQAARYR
jgi:hypothetical protein